MYTFSAAGMHAKNMQNIAGSKLVCTFLESRSELVCTGMFWYALVYAGMCWYVMVYTCIYLHVLLHYGMWYWTTGMIWHAYEYFGMNLYVLVHAGIYWYMVYAGTY